MEPDDKSYTISLTDDKSYSLTDDNSITIDLNDTYGATTSYIVSGSNDITLSIDSSIDLDWLKEHRITLEPTMWEDCMPDPQKLKRMCEQYPALEKVYENFKTVYSMVEQDWKGNHSGEDDIPF